MSPSDESGKQVGSPSSKTLEWLIFPSSYLTNLKLRSDDAFDVSSPKILPKSSRILLLSILSRHWFFSCLVINPLCRIFGAWSDRPSSYGIGNLFEKYGPQLQGVSQRLSDRLNFASKVPTWLSGLESESKGQKVRIPRTHTYIHQVMYTFHLYPWRDDDLSNNNRILSPCQPSTAT